MVQEALLLFTVGIPSSVPALWLISPPHAHCSGSSTLSPRCLRDAPKSHCNIPAARLNHCLTEPILQTSGKAKAASACNRGAGSTGGAGCNCLFKPVRDPRFLIMRALEQRPCGYVLANGACVEVSMPGGWAGAPGPSLAFLS